MRLFVSWSGELSLQIAELLKTWLPDVLQGTDTWISTDSIDKGSMWFDDIVRQLEDTDISIICLTPENKEARWIHFEAGFLARSLTRNRVCPLLINLSHSDLAPPLSLFNGTLPTRDDMLRLVKTINRQNGDNAISEDRLERAFDQWWSDFDDRYNQILNDHGPKRISHTWKPQEMGEFFHEYYRHDPGMPVFQRSGRTYPVFYRPTPVIQEDDLNSILENSQLDVQIAREFAIDGDAHFKLLQKSNRKVDRGLTYIMKNVTISPEDGTIKIHAQLGTYKDMLVTCDVLREEAEKAFSQILWSQSDYASIKALLAIRNQYAQSVLNPFVDGRLRCATLGILTLIVYRDESGRSAGSKPTYKALLAQRSNECATYPGYYHVVPSFVFQPFTAYYQMEFDVVRNIYREYAEELFGVTEAQRNIGMLSPEGIFQLDEVKHLRSMLDITTLESPKARLFLTGYAMSALDLRPQICTLLLIDDPHWSLSPDFSFNWEWAPFSQQMEQEAEETGVTSSRILTPIDVGQSEDDIVGVLDKVNLVPEAIVAFWLGVDKAKRAIDQQV